MKHSSLYLFVLLLAVACKPSVPSQYIQPGELEDILYDYHVAEAMSKTTGGGDYEYNKHLYISAVLKKYGVSEADFDSSLVYYYTRADKLHDIYAHVSERLNEEAKLLGASVGDISRYSQYSATGDTANIWSDASDALLIPRPTQNRFDFTVKVDTAFYLGDSFMFQFMSEYLYQTGSKDAVVCIVTKYEGDSIIQTTNHVSASGLAQIRVPANREKKLKEMRGFIYLNDGGDISETRKMMYISQLQLIRFHSKEILKADETARKDSVQTDSLQRVSNPGGPVPDTLRRRIIGRRQGGTPLPPSAGAGVHRVDARPVDLKERQ
jgi:hypothetical protein